MTGVQTCALPIFEALGIAAADPFPIDQNTRGVDGGGVDQGRWRHALSSFLNLTAATTGSAWPDPSRDRPRPTLSNPERAHPPTSLGVVVVQVGNHPISAGPYDDFRQRLRQEVLASSPPHRAA